MDTSVFMRRAGELSSVGSVVQMKESLPSQLSEWQLS